MVSISVVTVVIWYRFCLHGNMGSPWTAYRRPDRVRLQNAVQKVRSKKGAQNEGAPGHGQCVPGGAFILGLFLAPLAWDSFLGMSAVAASSDMSPETML